ncbi:hypothetical protein HN446_04460 [bacterium]|jgi:hypothetical protein|nr:hypothetical protein [bacterium]
MIIFESIQHALVTTLFWIIASYFTMFGSMYLTIFTLSHVFGFHKPPTKPLFLFSLYAVIALTVIITAIQFVDTYTIIKYTAPPIILAIAIIIISIITAYRYTQAKKEK